jgi:hypothetical protein
MPAIALCQTNCIPPLHLTSSHDLSSTDLYRNARRNVIRLTSTTSRSLLYHTGARMIVTGRKYGWSIVLRSGKEGLLRRQEAQTASVGDCLGAVLDA